MALLNSRALKREATPPMSDKVAKKDIVRKNHLGQNVVVVPKGQLIPDGLELERGEGETKKDDAPLENKASEGRPSPKPAAKNA
jgi:hypothetical protein